MQYPRPPRHAGTPETTPESLATRLDAWALRREKVLFVLDRAQAKVARKLAERCRSLFVAVADIDSNLELRQQWHTIREEADALFASDGDLSETFDPRKRVGNE